MRINLTSMKENQKINEITKIIEQAFSKTNYKFKIIDGVNTFNKITFELRGSILPHVGKTSDILFSSFEYDNSKNILTT